jgi:mannose-6-phosphate isomerase-like protein (cupin superfamily)
MISNNKKFKIYSTLGFILKYREEFGFKSASVERRNMKMRVMNISEFPIEEVKGHQGFTARSLVDPAGKGVTVRMLHISPGGLGPVPPHKHSDVHLFLVLAGRLSLVIDSVIHHIAESECVEVPGDKFHQLKNDGDKDISVLAIKWT